MPASVMQRAEKVLNSISYTLRDIQSQTYSTQDSIAKQIDQAYLDQKWVLYRKPFMEALSLTAYGVVAYNPTKLMEMLGLDLTKDKKAEGRKEALDFLSRITGAISSLAVEPKNSSVQATLQKLQSGQTELSAFLNGLATTIQTHEAALQRLQNMEGANRQAG